MTNKIKKFLFILEHLIPDGRDEIPTFALYHPLLTEIKSEAYNTPNLIVCYETSFCGIFRKNCYVIFTFFDFVDSIFHTRYDDSMHVLLK